MIDYEEVVEAIWRYDIPRIDIDEDVTTLYKKNYIYLNEYTMYVVEDITGTHTDPYHYKLYFHTDILPDVEVRS